MTTPHASLPRARSRTPASRPVRLILAAGAMVALSVAAASAQPADGRAPRRKPRPALIGLQDQAKERRPGQALPGDPAPPPTETPTPSAPPAAVEPPPTMREPEPAPIPVPEPEPEPVVRAAPATPAPRAPRDPLLTLAPPKRPVPVSPDPADGPEPIEAGAAESPAAADLSRPEPADPAVIAVAPVTGAAQPVEVRVVESGRAGLVQWRDLSEQWSTPGEADRGDRAAGAGQDRKVGRLEIRAGLDGGATFIIDDAVEVRIGRLARIRVERVETGAASPVVIHLLRGSIEVAPAADSASLEGGDFATVRTPDRTVAVRSPVRLSVDAFAGTRQQILR